jgi:hypothetical protein
LSPFIIRDASACGPEGCQSIIDHHNVIVEGSLLLVRPQWAGRKVVGKLEKIRKTTALNSGHSGGGSSIMLLGSARHQ